MPWPVAHGPDIAHYQEITGEPVDPAWRLFSHKCSEGANSGDTTFPSRWKWMRTQDFRYRGAYHWLRSDTAVAAQAKNIIGRLDAQGGLRQGEFVQSDWETTPGITVNTAEDEREFCDRLEQHYGRACTITYSSDWIPDSTIDTDLISEFYEWLALTQGNAPLWYANYNTDPLNTRGGQQECKRYGADVWQFTSSFRHPSIVSKSGGGFDMNHVLRWETLDRIAGYRIAEQPDPPPPPVVVPSPIEEDDMRAVIYTVAADDDPNQTAWFRVNDNDQIRQVVNGHEYQLLIARGDASATPESTGHFRQMLRTYQPVGELNANGADILGGASVAYWDERAKVTMPPPPVVPGGEQVVRVDVNVTGP